MHGLQQQALTEEKYREVAALLEVVEQATYMSKENQQLVTRSSCWHGLLAQTLLVAEAWSPGGQPLATQVLLQLVQVLVNLVNGNGECASEFVDSGLLERLVSRTNSTRSNQHNMQGGAPNRHLCWRPRWPTTTTTTTTRRACATCASRCLSTLRSWASQPGSESRFAVCCSLSHGTVACC